MPGLSFLLGVKMTLFKVKVVKVTLFKVKMAFCKTVQSR